MLTFDSTADVFMHKTHAFSKVSWVLRIAEEHAGLKLCRQIDNCQQNDFTDRLHLMIDFLHFTAQSSCSNKALRIILKSRAQKLSILRPMESKLMKKSAVNIEHMIGIFKKLNAK